MKISIIMPALNEQENIGAAVDETLSALRRFELEGEVVVVNDGSRDRTPSIVEQKMRSWPGLVRMVTHARPLGFGASFWDGVDQALGDAVCLVPGDNENDPAEILRYAGLLDHVDMVVPFSMNRHVRTAARNTISSLFLAIVNATFYTSFQYTNGTSLYRRSLLLELPYRCQDFFFLTDILVHLVKRGYLYAEVPYRVKKRVGGASKALSLRSLWRLSRSYVRLFADIYRPRRREDRPLAADSVSFSRLQDCVAEVSI